MPKAPKRTPAPFDPVEVLAAGADFAAGAPQEILPPEARADVVVHAPKMTRVDRMVATDWNTNVQDAATFHELLEDIRKSGFSGAIEVVPFEKDGETWYLVVAGEWRWKAARVLGIPEIPASHLTHQRFTQRDFQMVLSIRRNTIKGTHDKEKFRAAVRELATRYPDSDELRRALAFTRQEDWKRLVGQTREGLKKQGATPEMMRAFDEKALHAKSLADLSVIVSRLYDLYKDTVPFGFMVFTYGKQEHLYVAATKGTLRAIKAICGKAQSKGVDVNTLLGPALTALDERLPVGPEGPAPALPPETDGPF